MTIISALRDYIATCPALSGGLIHVDFLAPDDAAYSIDLEPDEPVVKTYMDGSSVRQVLFTFVTRSLYGADVRQQLDNISFFETFQNWLEKQMLLRNLPDLGEGRTARKVETTTYGYAFAEGTDYACYQIQMRLTYLQEGLTA